MRKFLVSVAVATATLAAVPAAAQYRDNNPGRDHNPGYGQRGPGRPAVANLLRQLDQVDARIQRSLQRRIISQREAFGLRRESNQLRGRIRYEGRDGIGRREFAELQVRVNRLEQRLRVERHDRDGRRN